jgi:DNA-binding transcriptional regulator YiaG
MKGYHCAARCNTCRSELSYGGPTRARSRERAKALNCSRVQLAKRLAVSRAYVSRWEKSLPAPQPGDAARLRALLGESIAPGVEVYALRKKLAMKQRVFGEQFGVSRQQVQSGRAAPRGRTGGSSKR